MTFRCAGALSFHPLFVLVKFDLCLFVCWIESGAKQILLLVFAIESDAISISQQFNAKKSSTECNTAEKCQRSIRIVTSAEQKVFWFNFTENPSISITYLYILQFGILVAFQLWMSTDKFGYSMKYDQISHHKHTKQIHFIGFSHAPNSFYRSCRNIRAVRI